jgi:hypothetical protein
MAIGRMLETVLAVGSPVSAFSRCGTGLTLPPLGEVDEESEKPFVPPVVPVASGYGVPAVVPPGIVERGFPSPEGFFLFLQPVKVVHADVVIKAAKAAATNRFVAFFMFYTFLSFIHKFLFMYLKSLFP